MDTVIPLSRQNNPAREPGAPHTAALAEQLLALHERLIGCDDENLLLQRFLAWSDGNDLASGLGLHLQGEDRERQLGEAHPYRCTYQLTLDGEHLGEITLMRRGYYGDAHLRTIERGLAALAKGLRLARNRRRLEVLATRDALTGLLNRKALDDGLVTEFARTRRLGSPLAILLLDVDDFKVLNDREGHLAGDSALRSIGDVLLASTRDTDLVFRHGGDEFAVLMPGTDQQAAAEVVARIHGNLARQPVQPAKGVESLDLPAVSIGVAEHRPGEAPMELLDRADKALYRAKAEGRQTGKQV